MRTTGWLLILLFALGVSGPACAQGTDAQEAYAGAMQSIERGDYDAALQQLQQAEQALGTPAPAARVLRAQILVARGGALGRLGRYAQSDAVQNQVLALGDASELRPWRRAALINLAHNAARTGHFAQASQHFDAALALLDASDPPHQRAEAQYAFAVSLAISGDHERAADVSAAALASELAMQPPRPRKVVLARFLHGTELMESERAAQALPVFEQTQAEVADAFPDGHPLHALVAMNHANVLLQLERLDQARRYYQRALDLHPDNGAPERMFPLAGRATVALWQGDGAAAQRDFDIVVPAIESSLGPSSGASQFVRTGRVAALWANGRVDEAFTLAVANEQRRQATLDGIAPEFAERQALALKEFLQPDYEWVVAIAAAAPTPARVRQAWELLMAARGEVTANVARRRAAARAATDPVLSQLWQRWRESNEALAAAAVDGADAGGDRAALRNASEAAERALARKVGGLERAREERATTIAQLAQGLPDDAALVVFVHLRYGQPGAFDRALHTARCARRVAFVLAAGAPPRLVDLGPAAPVEASARAWHRSLRDPGLALATVDAQGATLRRLLLDPLALPERARRLFVIADGALARVNLAALPSAEAGRYLVESGTRVHYLEHERDLLAPPHEDVPAQRLVLIGAPTADAPGATRAAACDTGFSELPHALRELDAIDALWRRQRHAAPRTRLVGAAATKPAVLAALPGSSIVHFATHGIAFGSECRPGQRGAALKLRRDDDELMSALVLSRSDTDPASALLGAREIAALDLDGTRWVVLSACETGLGREHAGEGVFGLRRAFRIAGAATVLMSLWPVQDAASADWMRALYDARLGQHRSAIDAVAQAQRALLQARRDAGQSVHPYYWAAFISAGDWR